VRVPAVIGALAVWIQNQKTKKRSVLVQQFASTVVGPRQRSRTVCWVLRDQSDASRGHLLWPNVKIALTLRVPTSFIIVNHF